MPIQPLFGDVLRQSESHLAYGEIRRVRQRNGWSEEEDAALCEAISEGKTFREAAKVLPKRTRDACIGRMHRIVNKMERNAMIAARSGHPA